MPKILKNKWAVVSLAVVGVIIVVSIISARNGNGVETVSPTVGDLVRTVSVSGKVIPAQSAELAFETSGIVNRVYKDVGQSVVAGEVIIALDQSELNADLLKAKADLEAAEAELGKIETNGGEVEVENARRTLVQSITDAYTTSDDAVHNKTDQYFDNPRSPLPEFRAITDDNDFEDKLNDNRYKIELLLRAWKDRIGSLAEDTYSESDLNTAKSNMAQILSFLDDAAKALGEVESNPDLLQTTIDKWRADTAQARTSVSGALIDMVTKGNALKTIVSDAPVREANVRGFEAAVVRLEAQIRKASLRSPITGVVSRQDIEAGESVSANTSVVSVISNGYEVEAFVPEVSIAGLLLENSANITLDAYGEETVFGAKVIHIDPAETIRDGVSTYKVRLAFTERDERIRSGMTANIDIETFRKENTLLVPLRSVLMRADGTRAVFVKDNGGFIERTIETGDSDSSGNIEVISGLVARDVIRFEPLATTP